MVISPDGEAAKVKLNFTQSVKGRKVGGKCRPHGRRSAKKCTRTVSRGTLTLNGKQGRNKIHFEGHLSRRKALKPGRYKLILTATDAAGCHLIAHAIDLHDREALTHRRGLPVCTRRR